MSPPSGRGTGETTWSSPSTSSIDAGGSARSFRSGRAAGGGRRLAVAQTVAFGASALALGEICLFLYAGAGGSALSTSRRDGTGSGGDDGCRDRGSANCERRGVGGGGGHRSRRVVRLAEDDCGSIVPVGSNSSSSSRRSCHSRRRRRPIEAYHNTSYVDGFLLDPKSRTGLQNDNAQPRDLWSDEASGCVPMKNWQTTSFPSCNDLHEMDMPGGSVKTARSLHGKTDVAGGTRYMTRGGSRMVWRSVDDVGKVVILKTLRVSLSGADNSS